MENEGILIVLSGPSGTGKDSILREMSEISPNFKLSVSCTTRAPRSGEVNGKDYIFVSKDTFSNMVDSGEMLEWAEFCGNYYGTPKREIENDISNGINVVLEIEVQGAKQVIEKCPEAVSVFVVPPSVQDLKKRLYNRNLDSVETIQKRIIESKREISLATDYDYVVVNDDLKKCAMDILSIIRCETFKTKRRKNVIERVLKDERVVSR